MLLQSATEFVSDYLGFLRERKRFWLLPILVILLLLGTLVFFTLESSVAPLIYTLF